MNVEGAAELTFAQLLVHKHLTHFINFLNSLTLKGTIDTIVFISTAWSNVGTAKYNSSETLVTVRDEGEGFSQAFMHVYRRQSLATPKVNEASDGSIHCLKRLFFYLHLFYFCLRAVRQQLAVAEL